MARRVFFSFYYKEDVSRASVVRNSWLTKPDRESAGFWDAAEWEKVQARGKEAIRKWIREQMNGTSVTVVLIGSNTAYREYVQYEIQHSWDSRNGLIGVYIHSIRDLNKFTVPKGPDPFKQMGWDNFKTYDWVSGDGYNNLGGWVESAYQRAQKRD